jgi:squalene-hopene cyclase-like protein/prenyltransferase/squalene oxidase-like repeat protein
MTRITAVLLATGVAALSLAVYADTSKQDPVDASVAKAIKWLVSVQGQDGGWGQDGGETSYVRQGERLESNGNDVANTAVAVEALLHTGNTPSRGQYREQMLRAVGFILSRVEQSPADGLAITDLRGTQIQRKLGPYIDTFLTSKLLAELDGTMADAKSNARVRADLQKCVAKIEKNQQKDGSWNIAGGWAPILGTSMASQSLAIAQSKGAAEPRVAMDRIRTYTLNTAAPAAAPPAAAAARPGVVMGGVTSTVIVDGAAGVPLYKKAQELEQLSRSDEDRKNNARQIREITGQLADASFVSGFGSIGGEEFFSYLNISDSLHRTGGAEWQKWNGDMKAKLLKLQNEDGTWAGHHCITGRVAVTSAAVLLLTADREPAPATVVRTTSTKR